MMLKFISAVSNKAASIKLPQNLGPSVLMGLAVGLMASLSRLTDASGHIATSQDLERNVLQSAASSLQAPLFHWLVVALVFGLCVMVVQFLTEKLVAGLKPANAAVARLFTLGPLWILVIGWVAWHYGKPPPNRGMIFAVVAVAAFGLSACALWRLVRREVGTTRSVTSFATAVLLGILLFSNIFFGVSAANRESDRPNVIFIGVDTLRADHLSCYGYHRKTSPRIDDWARQGVLFENCIASIPRTTQSLASIMTGKYPYAIGVRKLKDKLPADELAIAEILKDAGYQTLSVVGTGIPYKKVDQGFDQVVSAGPNEEYKAAKTASLAIQLINNTEGPYFLFAFLRDPHMFYTPPRIVFDSEYQGRFKKRLRYFPNKAECVFRNSYDQQLRSHAIGLYDSEIRYVDSQIKRLIDAIKKKSGNNIIVLFADHGESLGEHDFFYDHGDLLYQPGLHIPLIIDGIPFPQRRISEVVRSIDIVPTVLGELGIRSKNHDFMGIDLRSPHEPLEAYSESGQVLIRTAFSTGRRFLPGLEGRLRSLVFDNKKLIAIPKSDGMHFEYYDLATDPAETDNKAHVADIRVMKDKLLNWIELDKKNWGQPDRPFSEDELRSLRSLGYVGDD